MEKTKKKIKLKALTSCTSEQQLKVRDIRNQIGVRSNMFTDHEIGLNEHLNWISKLKSEKKQMVFAVLNSQQNPIGAVSIRMLDTFHKKADWALYLDGNEKKYEMGVAPTLEYNFIEYVFNILKLEKLNCEVIENNEAVVRLHKKFSFIEEGFKRENINKNGKRKGVYFLGLTKNEWLLNKSQIFSKYKSIVEKFTITIEE